MKIVATGSAYRQLSFGRSLNKQEMQEAYNVAQQARNLMGFNEGNRLLIIPSDKIPQADKETLKEKLKSFFDAAKKLLGINVVEITGDTNEVIEGSVKSALEENSMRRIVNFNVPGNHDDLVSSVEKLAGEYDGLRIFTRDGNVDSQQIETIENIFKRIKGENFDPSMLIYEHGEKAYDWGEPNHINPIYNKRVIVTSSNNLNDNNGLWGSRSFVTDRMHAKQGEFIHGLRNAFDGGDFASQISEERQIREAEHLLTGELKLQDDELLHPARFAAAKRADVVSSQNFYKHFADIAPGLNLNIENFESIYQQALQEGYGDNYFDSLAKVMKSVGLDKTSPEVYESVCKYRNALYTAGAKTADELASVGAEELEASYKNTANVVLQGVEVRRKAIEEAAQKAAEEAAKKARELEMMANFEIEQREVLNAGQELRNNMTHFSGSFFEKVINFTVRNKLKIAACAILAGLAVVAGTMYSYGKEVATKSKK